MVNRVYEIEELCEEDGRLKDHLPDNFLTMIGFPINEKDSLNYLKSFAELLKAFNHCTEVSIEIQEGMMFLVLSTLFSKRLN